MRDSRRPFIQSIHETNLWLKNLIAEPASFKNPAKSSYIDLTAGNYLFKLNNGNNRTICEICLKLRI